MTKNTAPNRGDIVYLNFNPQKGHEQSGFRPAVVISPKEYNSKSGLAVMCPITTKVKGYPFEVAITGDCEIGGVVLSDQLKSLDWNSRGCKFVEKMPVGPLEEVVAKIKALIVCE